MSKCQIKTGFLVLRDCENEALDNCSICGKWICNKHKRSHPQNQRVCCIDCYAKSLDEADAQSGNSLLNDGNHCCSCGQEVIVKAGKNHPQNKVIDPETNKVYCQNCYDNLTEDSSTMNAITGASLLSHNMYDDDYWYGYRNSFYRRHHYRPLSRGNHNNSTFKEDEIRAFDPKNNPQEIGTLEDSSDKDNVFDS